MDKRIWTHDWHTVCFQPCSLLGPVVWLHWVLFAGSCSSVTFHPTPKSLLPLKPQGSVSSLFSFHSEHSPKMTLSIPITFTEVKWKSLSGVWLCKPMDCSPPGSLSMEFSRQEHWSGLLFPSPGNLPNPGIEPRSPALQEDSLPSEPPGKPYPSLSLPRYFIYNLCNCRVLFKTRKLTIIQYH